MVYEPERDIFTFEPYAKLLGKSVPMTKRGVSFAISTIYDLSTQISTYIFKGRFILSKIWAYKNPINRKNEEATSDLKASILFLDLMKAVLRATI